MARVACLACSAACPWGVAWQRQACGSAGGAGQCRHGNSRGAALAKRDEQASLRICPSLRAPASLLATAASVEAPMSPVPPGARTQRCAGGRQLNDQLDLTATRKLCSAFQIQSSWDPSVRLPRGCLSGCLGWSRERARGTKRDRTARAAGCVQRASSRRGALRCLGELVGGVVFRACRLRPPRQPGFG